MSNIFLLTFMSLFMVSKIISAKFLHDSSGISICPLKHENDSDFGFAMGYQSFSNKLVVGAPSENVHGKVYICDMNGANVSSEIKCKEESIIIPKSSRHTKTVAFRLGASVSATSKHYLTCAPLWTFDIKEVPDVAGTCFFDGDHKAYSGLYEQYARDIKMGKPSLNARIFIGGFGWTTLIDEANDLLVVLKSSLKGNIAYGPISEEKITMNSLVSQNKTLNIWMAKHFNVGYGITAGKFFSKKTVYAFSMDTKDMRGVISFLDYDPPRLHLMASDLDTYAIQSKTIATKFGSVLAAADMNNDTQDDLLIGEPLYTEEDCVDCGALHVYLGGDLDTIGKKNYLQILGIDIFGRLGSAVAVKDLDGDGIAELSISAPYADKGLGVVYIISGYEVNQKLQMKEKLRLQLSELKHIQRVQKKDFRRLGFSLQFVSDTDDNGCSELVAGAPGKGEATLLKCVQAIDISLSSKVKDGKDVKEQDLNFTVEVCATVTYPNKPNDIDAHIKLTSSVIGEGILIPDPEVEINVSCRNCSSNQKTSTNKACVDVVVKLKYKEPGDYLFKSKAELLTDHIFNSTVFNSSWVVASPKSTLQTETKIPRHCKGDDCKPNLFMKIFWSRSKDDTYTVGSSSTETAIIEVFNNGSTSYDACVWVKVKGAQMSRLLDNECRQNKDGYTCNFKKPLRRDSKANINLLLKMDSSNEFKQLDVKAYLFEKCSSGVSNKDPKVLAIPYVLLTNDVSVSGANHERQFHELQKQDDKSKIMDVQEFLISNNGKITWKNIYATVSTKKTVNIENFKAKLGTFVCKEFDSEKEFVRKCSLDIMPNTTIKIIATTHILRKELENYLKDKKLKVEYAIQLHLIPTKDIKKTSIFSVLKFGTELAVGQNKFLIGIIAGVLSLLMLIIIFIVLYKYGFFKREEKKKLLVHRESIRQRSVRRNTHISSATDEQGVEGIPNAEANSDGDDVFDNDTKTITSNDDGKIETMAQVHS